MRSAMLLALVLAVPTTAVAQATVSGHASIERSDKIQVELGRRAASLRLHQLEGRHERAVREVVASAVLVGVGILSVPVGVGVILEDADAFLSGLITACAGGVIMLISGIWLGVARAAQCRTPIHGPARSVARVPPLARRSIRSPSPTKRKVRSALLVP